MVNLGNIHFLDGRVSLRLTAGVVTPVRKTRLQSEHHALLHVGNGAGRPAHRPAPELNWQGMNWQKERKNATPDRFYYLVNLFLL